MSTSIPVINRNNALPPLLLPDLRSLGRQHQNFVVDIGDEFFSGKRVREFTGNEKSNLDSLATVALKRCKLDGSIPDGGLVGGVSRVAAITPPPSVPSTAPVSAPVSASGSASGSATMSPSPSFPEVNERPAPSLKMEKKASSGSSSGSVSMPNASNSKRQRIGPSCDGCRLKKIKCDAKIEVLLQDDSIIPLVSNKLHHIFTQDEIKQSLNTILRNVNLPETVLKNDASRTILIKHIDKIVHFQSCTSCCKRKAGTQNCCEFSKGFTRADINVFSKIKTRLKKSSIYEMDCSDYKNAGF